MFTYMYVRAINKKYFYISVVTTKRNIFYSKNTANVYHSPYFSAHSILVFFEKTNKSQKPHRITLHLCIEHVLGPLPIFQQLHQSNAGTILPDRLCN